MISFTPQELHSFSHSLKGIPFPHRFDQFYGKMRHHLVQLHQELDQPLMRQETISKLQEHLKIGAKLAISKWGKTLERDRTPAYKIYQTQLTRLQQKGGARLRTWLERNDPTTEEGKTRLKMARWIEANQKQLHCAALLNLDEVPFRYEEIPSGSVILTNPSTYIMNANIRRGYLSLIRSVILKIKAFICWLLTGKKSTHASLALGGGHLFDLDKDSAVALGGRGKILQKTGHVCYHDVLTPNREKMIEAHNHCFPETPVANFEELWQKIEREAREKGPQLVANVLDLKGIYFSRKRREGYDSSATWDAKERLVCSASISALFSKFGIDIGKELRKTNRQITPADLFASSFFEHRFVLKI